MSHSLDPDQFEHFVWPDLGPNCLLKLAADDKNNSSPSVNKVKHSHNAWQNSSDKQGRHLYTEGAVRS